MILRTAASIEVLFIEVLFYSVFLVSCSSNLSSTLILLGRLGYQYQRAEVEVSERNAYHSRAVFSRDFASW
jgi:hypothetical protein